MFKVVRCDVVKGVDEFVGWFKSYDEAEEWADAHDDETWQHVVLGEDQDFIWF